MEDRLRQFRGVIEAGSFTKAAAEMHISQPALSNAIAKLERELKTTLLNRTKKPFEVTAAGYAALKAAKNLARQERLLLDDLARLAGEKPGLRLGMIDSVAMAFCAETDILTTLERTYDVSLLVNTTSVLRNAMLQHELDYALTVGATHDIQAGYTVEPLGAEPMVFVTHPALSADKRDHFISYNHGSYTYNLIADAFLKAHQHYKPTFYSTSPEVMLQLVTQGRGVAVLPYLTVREHLHSNKLQPLKLAEHSLLYRPINTLHYTDASLQATINKLNKHVSYLLDGLQKEALEIQ